MSFRRRTKEEATKPSSSKQQSSGGSRKYVKLGAILEKKDGGFYLAFPKDEEIEISVNGEVAKYINIEDPTAKFERFVESGKMTEEEAQESVDKIPEFVIFEVTAVIE